MDPDGALSLCNPETAEVHAGDAEERAARLEAEARVAELQARLREMQAGSPSPGTGHPHDRIRRLAPPSAQVLHFASSSALMAS